MLVEPQTPIPERFGPFRVASVLARGGMGVVYRATHELSGERIAVKTVTQHRAFDLVGLRREIHALQRVDHPGVVRIIASGVRDGIPWYAMPLLEGETLFSFARALRLPRAERSEVPTTRMDAGASATQPFVSPHLETPDDFASQTAPAAFGRLPEVLTIARRLCATLAFVGEREGLAEAATALGDLTAAEGHLVAALGLLGEAQPGSFSWVASLARDLSVQFAHRLSPLAVERGGLERARLEEAARTFDLLAERAYFGYDATTMIAASLRALNRAERAGLPMARPYAMLGITAGLSMLRPLARKYFALARDAAADNDDVFAAIAESAYHTGETAWDAARPLNDLIIERATRSRDLRGVGFGETMLGHEQFYRGHFQASAATYRRIAERARRDENQQLMAWGLYAGARALIPLGEIEQAAAMLREAEQLLASQEDAPSKLICAGLSASVELRRGDREAALAAVDRCQILIRTIPPTVFSIISGYQGAAEVRIDLARVTGDKATLRDAERAVSDLERFAFAIPLGRPAAARLRATLLAMRGKERAAIAKLEGALATARNSAMRHEEGLAHALLARLLSDDRGTTHREAATAIFSEVGCVAPVERQSRLTP